RICDAQGPAMMRLRSRTLTWESGPDIASVLYDPGGEGGRPFLEGAVPAGQSRPALTPVQIGKAEIQIGQGAADRDMTDGESLFCQRGAFLFQSVQRRAA